MKNLKAAFALVVALAVANLVGGLAVAGGDHEEIDPVKTCGVGSARDIVAIDQLWDAYAHNLDSGDADGVADLFVPGGGYILLYNNRKTQTLDPMGYSPNSASDGKGGIIGGGCTALGHDEIVNFLTAIGLGNDFPRPQLSHHIVTSKSKKKVAAISHLTPVQISRLPFVRRYSESYIRKSNRKSWDRTIVI
jgi:hypothetical protein